MRVRDDRAQCRLSRQQSGLAEQAMRWLRLGNELAATLGKKLE